MKRSLALLFCLYSLSLPGQSVIGLWKNIDDEDGKEKSIIEIYEEDGRVHGKVIKLLEAATLKVCTACKDERKDAPLEGMVILWDMKMEKKGREAKKGKILDPKKGKTYDCKISLENEDILKVRGYIKSPMFGRTQKWHRVKEE